MNKKLQTATDSLKKERIQAITAIRYGNYYTNQNYID